MSDVPRLSAATLAAAAPDVEPPRYARRSERRICHIGAGRFHRAHQAYYLHRLLQQGDGEGWGICAIGLKRADAEVHARLQPQDQLYSLWELDGDKRRGTVVGSLMQWVDAAADADAAIAVMADPATHIISLTVTESGYCLDARGALDCAHPDIAHDLAGGAPRSAPGLIVRALAARRAAGGSGVTLMSCDNLLENGKVLRACMLHFAQRVDAALERWIERECSFPCSMVDRITPAADDARSAQLSRELGLRDDALVFCEPWQQWVIEDHFVAGRPAFEKAGAVFSMRVRDYERMKVGMLNGGHSALSHVGLLLGHTRVHEALAVPELRLWLAAYMDDVAQVLPPLPGVNYLEYRDALLARFSNPAIEDRLARLALDTTAKY
ncbi:MAG TPA: mannitol dehydrogenase family protein, partial [Nevskiaceae bacterium]|nr:mannitol dehydrogenase family protein [Nevskiaceae bacterium]